MYKNSLINYYRDICLLSFLVVILFLNNIITYVILGIMIVYCIFKKGKMNDYLLCMITVLIFIINNILLIKMILSIDYALYFMLVEEKKKKNIYFDKIYNDNTSKISKLLEKGEIDSKIKTEIYGKTVIDINRDKENRLLRFDNNEYYYSDDFFNETHVIFHLIILFLSILIGSCVI